MWLTSNEVKQNNLDVLNQAWLTQVVASAASLNPTRNYGQTQRPRQTLIIAFGLYMSR